MAVRPIIGDHAIARAGDTLGARDVANRAHPCHDFCVTRSFRKIIPGHVGAFGDDKGMYRCLGADIGERQGVGILMHSSRRDLASEDTCEDILCIVAHWRSMCFALFIVCPATPAAPLSHTNAAGCHGDLQAYREGDGGADISDFAHVYFRHRLGAVPCAFFIQTTLALALGQGFPYLAGLDARIGPEN